jgi:hypothetical protein
MVQLQYLICAFNNFLHLSEEIFSRRTLNELSKKCFSLVVSFILFSFFSVGSEASPEGAQGTATAARSIGGGSQETHPDGGGPQSGGGRRTA